MDTFEAIETRRSVRRFDPTHRLTADEERRILSAAMLAPTSFNIQHWRFVVLRDPELRRRVRAAGNDQAQITDASLLVLLTADRMAWAKSPERYWRNAPPEIAKMLVDWMGPFHEGNERLQLDEAQRSIGMASQNIMLAATAMGYQTSIMIGYEFDTVAEMVRLPADHVLGPMIAIGKGTQAPLARGGQLAYGEVVLENGF